MTVVSFDIWLFVQFRWLILLSHHTVPLHPFIRSASGHFKTLLKYHIVKISDDLRQWCYCCCHCLCFVVVSIFPKGVIWIESHPLSMRSLAFRCEFHSFQLLLHNSNIISIGWFDHKWIGLSLKCAPVDWIKKGSFESISLYSKRKKLSASISLIFFSFTRGFKWIITCVCSVCVDKRKCFPLNCGVNDFKLKPKWFFPILNVLLFEQFVNVDRVIYSAG